MPVSILNTPALVRTKLRAVPPIEFSTRGEGLFYDLRGDIIEGWLPSDFEEFHIKNANFKPSVQRGVYADIEMVAENGGSLQ